MKSGIHPKYYPEGRITCACGNVMVVGATVPEMTTEVCSNCHPYFTGEQRIVDTAGQVERFMRRLEAGETQRIVERTRGEQLKEEQRAAKRRRRGLAPIKPRARATKAPAPADESEASASSSETAES